MKTYTWQRGDWDEAIKLELKAIGEGRFYLMVDAPYDFVSIPLNRQEITTILNGMIGVVVQDSPFGEMK